MTFLQVDHLSKTFAGHNVLDDVSFSLAADELVVVLGPTGAGKTTLLRCLCGLERGDAATQIQVNGNDIRHLSPADRDMALVFQNFSLYPDWTVSRNLAFPLQAPGRTLSAAACVERIEWAAKLLRIDHLLQRKASQLSGGEMQRVAIGRAIVRKPKLFLMDEPLTNLDAKLRESLRLELLQLRKSLKSPMIYVTHDQAEALSMADRIIVLDQGKVLQIGTPQEIYQHPVSVAVARQLGQVGINVFDVIARDGYWCALDGQRWLRIDGISVADGGRAQLGIRPEHIQHNSEKTIRDCPLLAEIKLCELSGPDLLILASVNGAPVHCLWSKQRAVKIGETIPLHIAAEHVIVWRP